VIAKLFDGNAFCDGDVDIRVPAASERKTPTLS
jgi:hypothetical protein